MHLNVNVQGKIDLLQKEARGIENCIISLMPNE